MPNGVARGTTWNGEDSWGTQRRDLLETNLKPGFEAVLAEVTFSSSHTRPISGPPDSTTPSATPKETQDIPAASKPLCWYNSRTPPVGRGVAICRVGGRVGVDDSSERKKEIGRGCRASIQTHYHPIEPLLREWRPEGHCNAGSSTNEGDDLCPFGGVGDVDGTLYPVATSS